MSYHFVISGIPFVDVASGDQLGLSMSMGALNTSHSKFC